MLSTLVCIADHRLLRPERKATCLVVLECRSSTSKINRQCLKDRGDITVTNISEEDNGISG